MIVSKPKSTALVALGIFIIICFGIGGYGLNSALLNPSSWIGYMVAGVFLSLGVLLLLRQLLSYKVVHIGDHIKVVYPFRLQEKRFKLKELIAWNQTIIKTKNAPYKQLELKFDSSVLKLSVQENTNYEQILKFLKRRASKKEIR